MAYLKVGPQVGTYSDYLRAAREAEKGRFDRVVSEVQGSKQQMVCPNHGPLASFP